MSKIELTSEEEKKYIESKGQVCPVCNKKYTVEGGSVEMDGDKAYQEVTCTSCGASWTDIYTLTGVLDSTVETDEE